MEIATRRDNVHLTDHGHLPALTKPEQRTLQAAKPVDGHALTLTYGPQAALIAESFAPRLR
jgi:hypothetical protein